MEWLLLLLLVAAIVVPLVLLSGFTGCGFSTTLGPSAPTIVSAIPLDANTVELEWTDTNTSPREYQVERTKGGEVAEELDPFASSPAPGQPHRFVDHPLLGGTKYSYRVRAIFTDTGEITPFSNPAAVETWARAFTSTLTQDGTNEPSTGDCVVQRVSPGTLARAGNLIGITVRGAGAGNGDLVLSRVTISSPATVGDPFDSADTPLDITTSPVTVTAGLTLPLPAAAFNVDADEPLLLAFDVDDPGIARFVRNVPHTAYIKQAPVGGKVTEAGTRNRAGFPEHPNELWFVEAIDVATKWPPIS